MQWRSKYPNKAGKLPCFIVEDSIEDSMARHSSSSSTISRQYKHGDAAFLEYFEASGLMQGMATHCIGSNCSMDTMQTQIDKDMEMISSMIESGIDVVIKTATQNQKGQYFDLIDNNINNIPNICHMFLIESQSVNQTDSGINIIKYIQKKLNHLSEEVAARTYYVVNENRSYQLKDEYWDHTKIHDYPGNSSKFRELMIECGDRRLCSVTPSLQFNEDNVNDNDNYNDNDNHNDNDNGNSKEERVHYHDNDDQGQFDYDQGQNDFNFDDTDQGDDTYGIVDDDGDLPVLNITAQSEPTLRIDRNRNNNRNKAMVNDDLLSGISQQVSPLQSSRRQSPKKYDVEVITQEVSNWISQFYDGRDVLGEEDFNAHIRSRMYNYRLNYVYNII